MPTLKSSSEDPGDFEKLVWQLLKMFADEHPKRVSAKYHPVITLHNDQTVVPDFELSYELPYQIDHRLIECQDRARSSQDVLHKIRSVRTLGPYNRFIFLYRNVRSISDALRDALKADGVVHYEIYEFAAFLESLSGTLEALDLSNRQSDLKPKRYNNAVMRWEIIQSLKVKPLRLGKDLSRERPEWAELTEEELQARIEEHKSIPRIQEIIRSHSWHKDEGMLGGRKR